MEKKRIEWIDSLKGALMIGVIWSHSSANTGGGYWLTACYMAAFYFISGYISGNKNQKLSVLLKEKAKRLLFPCFVYGVVLVGIDVILSGTQGSLNKLIGVFYSRYMLFPHDLNNNVFFLKSYNSTLWFLTSMFLTSICFDAFRKCQRKKIFVLILFVLGYVLMYFPVLLPWSIDSVPVTTLIMIAGYYFRGVSLDSFSVKNKIVVLIVLLPIYLICITINQGINLSIREYGSDGIKGYLFYYIISLIGAVILMILFSVLPILKGLIFVGRHTMTYMCLQIFTLAISYKVFMFVHINDVVSGWIGVCVTLIMIWLVIKFYEAVSKKIKLFKYL